VTSPSSWPDVDLRYLVTSHLMDQGYRPVCVPFTLSHAHEAATQGIGHHAAMAPEAVWWHCTKMGQVTAKGILLEHGGQAIAEAGQPPLTDWPWNPCLGVGTEDPPPAVGQPPWHTATMTPLHLAHDGTEAGIEDALAAGRPVILVIEVTGEFENADADGMIEIPDIRSPAGDYHAVLAVGAATDPVRGRRLLVRNSWSEFWGAAGYGWLPMDYLIAYAIQAAIVAI
jgi:Papain family cysteine protease